MTVTGIYTITNLRTDKVYVGSVVNIEKRWKNHLKLLRRGCHHNRHLQNAWNKYGENLFKFEVLLSCRKGLLVYNEQQVIDKYIQNHGREILYNVCLIAGSQLGAECSLKTRAKLSAAKVGNQHLKGHKHTRETRAKMSEVHKGNQYCKGYKHTKEAKARMSKAQKGRKQSLEHIAKRSKALKGNQHLKGYVQSAEHIAKKVAARAGYKHSPESRAKMSVSQMGNQNRKGYKHSSETKAKISASLRRRT